MTTVHNICPHGLITILGVLQFSDKQNNPRLARPCSIKTDYEQLTVFV